MNLRELGTGEPTVREAKVGRMCFRVTHFPPACVAPFPDMSPAQLIYLYNISLALKWNPPKDLLSGAE